ncbi:MAG: ArsR/SmtB family transcription factor [Candidatus Limnocylindrales bacterium]
MMTVDDTAVDALAKAVADPTRRRIIVHLRDEPGATTAELGPLAPTISRFAVMKHLDVLRRAGLVRSMSVGRCRRHYLEADAMTPLRAWLAQVPG